jgi:type II secretory pathway pseudopilin PulG
LAGPQNGTGSNNILVILAVLGIGGLLFVGLLAALLIPALSTARTAARRSASMNNMRQIGLALHNYHDVYGEFPPQYVADSAGQPLYSWRVLILPYLEQDAISKAWDKTKAWDSPENAHLADMVLPVFQMPEETRLSNDTSYLAISGSNTLFEGAKSVKFREVIDGLSNTIIVVESKGSGVKWAEPRDLDIDSLTTVNSGAAAQINGGAARGAQALFADGSVQFVPSSTPPATLRQLGDRRDGSSVVLPRK